MATTLAIGVTGNIGSGKTEACRVFESQGGTIMYTDPLAKQILETDPRVRRSVSAMFETPVYREDGTLDRKMLARLIFSDDSAKAKIESIVHPRVIAAIEAEIARREEKGQGGMLFVESALIFEADIAGLFDYTVVVQSDAATADRRIMARDQVSEQEIAVRRKAQMPDEKKMEQADFVIYNNGSIQELEERCRFIYRLLAAITTTA